MKDKSSGSFETIFAMLFLAILAMPIFGIYLCAHPNSKEDDKTVGVIMIVLGFAIWLFAGIIS